MNVKFVTEGQFIQRKGVDQGGTGIIHWVHLEHPRFMYWINRRACNEGPLRVNGKKSQIKAIQLIVSLLQVRGQVYPPLAGKINWSTTASTKAVQNNLSKKWDLRKRTHRRRHETQIPKKWTISSSWRTCQIDLVECITDDFILSNWVCEACKAFGKDEEASARAADDDILDACLPVSRTKCS